MGLELLFLLLPLAAVSGWIIGRRGENRRQQQACQEMTAGYFKGLNYLLNDEEDKAIMQFLALSESNEDALDIHFALANLFKRRGEVDRAIRIHDTLLQRPAIDARSFQRAQLELALDYLKAGLFDRAESLLLEVHQQPEFRQRTHQHLLKIYQQEREWSKAIAIATPLLEELPQGRIPLAHYHCEQALVALHAAANGEAQQQLRCALEVDPASVRATLLQGEMLLQRGDAAAAISVYQRVERQDAALLSEIISPLKRCYELIEEEAEMATYLEGLLQRYASHTLAIAIARGRYSPSVQSRIQQLLERFLLHNPSLHSLLFLMESWFDPTQSPSPQEAAQRPFSCEEKVRQLQRVANQLWDGSNIYLCHHCGFQAKNLYWLCPGCKQWSTIKPQLSICGSWNR
ncbi:MAG: lipopolysaccharide assembly protein LapB [Gammaproteobacteria bacterium]|nr:lipopolysaccharide assembly protein LapB [Gammaproteobacteria bacterium]